MATGGPVYACGTCRVRFGDLDLMHGHYKSDWHRYNLKRKVAALPAVSVENFADIVKTYQQEVVKHSETPLTDQKDKLYCPACSKSFVNDKSMNAHLESKKHQEKSEIYRNAPAAAYPKASTCSVNERVGTQKPESMVEAAESDDWEDEDAEIPPYDVTCCLFCSKKSSSLEANFDHMSAVHSFFVPDLEFCSDPAGLVDYLGKKLTDGKMCLYCNQRFQDPLSVQRHMDSKGHTKMGFEGEFLLEYEDFYDYSDENDADLDEEGEEDLDGTVDGSGYEMTLPSGAVIGHRDLQRYYKQGLRPVRDLALINTVSRHYKALGWKEGYDEKKAHALQVAKELNRLRQKTKLAVGLQANKINMKHYRRQYGF